MLAEETMLIERNKQTIRRWVEMAWNRGDFTEARSVYAPDYKMHNSTVPDVHGPEGLEHFIILYRTGLPDLVMEVEDLVAEGDKVAWRFTARATQSGQLMGIPPTGKSAAVTGIVLSRFREGLWVEDWVHSDDLGLLRQLGVVPDPNG